MTSTKNEYIILRHLTMPDKGKCFFTSYRSENTDHDYTHGNTGELWYEIIGYAITVLEAQELCDSNYGGLPTMQEFDEWANLEVKLETLTNLNNLKNK